MSQTPRVLFLLSADFGEYVNASIFSRNQPLDCHFALPSRLAPYMGIPQQSTSEYQNLDDVIKLIDELRPTTVVLCSGYLFTINQIFNLQQLSDLVQWLRNKKIAIATTDPWARIWALKPDTRFTIYVGSQTEPDQERSTAMTQFQKGLESFFADIPHLFPIPINSDRADWLSCYNPRFARPDVDTSGESTEKRWLLIMSHEDLSFMVNLESHHFPGSLTARLGELLQLEQNQVTLVAPPRLFALAAEDLPQHERLTLVPFCDFATFENLVQRADIALYWNVLSASLLYCLYYRVPVAFFSKGHQVRVCQNLYRHAVENVYQGLPPLLLDPCQPIINDCSKLIKQHGLDGWVSAIDACYADSLQPTEMIDRLGSYE